MQFNKVYKVKDKNHWYFFNLSNKTVDFTTTFLGILWIKRETEMFSSLQQWLWVSDRWPIFRSFECRAKHTSIVCDFTQSHAKQLQIPLSLMFHLSHSETGHFRPKGSPILPENSTLKENHVHTFEVRSIKILFAVWCELSALNEGLQHLSWAGIKVCVWEGCVCRGGGQREMLHLCSITWGRETEEEQRRRRSMVGHFHI